MKRYQPIIYFSAALGLLLYAVPQLDIGSGLTAANVFAISWTGMILLIAAAHLYQWLGVNEETRQELARIRKYKKYRTQAWMEARSRRMVQMRK